MMPPLRLLGSDTNFAAVRALPLWRATGVANLGSDPKNLLPSEGTAAPAVWQSQSRGPNWLERTSVAFAGIVSFA